MRVSGSLNRIQSAWHWFLGISMAYGYKPLRLIYAAAVLILVGWGVFGYASAHAAMVPSKPAEVSIALPASYPRFSSLMYSVDTFLPIIDFYQEGYWIPNTHTALGRGVMTYVWFHTAMGWALSTLAVIGFSGLVRKE